MVLSQKTANRLFPRESAIGKTLGATPKDLVVLLSRNFLLLLGITTVLAAPLGWLLGTQFLNFFTQRIPMGIGLLLPGILLLFGVGLLTIGSQSARAALANPVKSLRSE